MRAVDIYIYIYIYIYIQKKIYISPILPTITLAVSDAANRYGNAMPDPATNVRIARYENSFYRRNQSLSS